MGGVIMRRVKIYFGIGLGLILLGIVGYVITGVVMQDGMKTILFGLPTSKLSYIFSGLSIFGWVFPWIMVYSTHFIRKMRYRNLKTVEEDDCDE